MRFIRTLAAVALLTALGACAASERHVATGYDVQLDVGDGLLFLQVRGENPDAPVLLWLHGGPGGAERPLFQFFNEDLERRFRVAYLDQRSAGRSKDRRVSPAALTVEKHLGDLDRVVDYLRNREHVPRIVLVGHSWGSLLGVLYAKRHPNKVAAVAGISQVVAPVEDQRNEFEFVRRWAEAAGDSRALRILAEIGQPPLDGRAELRLDRLVDRFGGTWHIRPNMAQTMVSAVVSGLVSPLEIGRFIRANERSVEAMTPELVTIDIRPGVTRLEVPVVMFLGNYDQQVSKGAARSWLARLKAPQISFRTFSHSAHNIPFEEPEAFSACLFESLGPLAEANGESAPQCPYPEDNLSHRKGD